MPAKDRRKTTRGAWVGGVVPDSMSEDTFTQRLDAFVQAAGWKKGQGNKPHLQMLYALVELFQEFEVEGVAPPVNYIRADLIHDGRLLELLDRHGALKHCWANYGIELEFDREGHTVPEDVRAAYGLPHRERHELTARQELDALGKKLRRVFILAGEIRRDIFAGVTEP